MSSLFKGRVVFFATDNFHKFAEARYLLSEFKMTVAMVRIKALELQSDSLEEIAKASATDTFNRYHLPIIVEDAGLFIDALNGFPGPYAAYVYRTLGNQGILNLLADEKNRRARFQSVIAYYSENLERPVCFNGEVLGEITGSMRRSGDHTSFGFDPIFKPASSAKTFAEMPVSFKSQISHRAKALVEFAKWYKEGYLARPEISGGA